MKFKLTVQSKSILHTLQQFMMPRSKLSVDQPWDVHLQWNELRQSSKDISIIQLYSRESKAQRERQRQIMEIQRKARRKDEYNRRLLELQERATEIRKNSQATAEFNILRLPPIQSPVKSTRRGLRRRVGGREMQPKSVLPDIDASKAFNLPATQHHHEPSRDPRFERLLSVLLTSEEHFDDLQRFAPPKKDSKRLSRVGHGY